MITFTKKQNSEYDLDCIVYAVKCALGESDKTIDDIDDYRLGIECMAACGYPESDLCYDNIVEVMQELGFLFSDFNFDFDENRYNCGFGCNALCALGETARKGS